MHVLGSKQEAMASFVVVKNIYIDEILMKDEKRAQIHDNNMFQKKIK